MPVPSPGLDMSHVPTCPLSSPWENTATWPGGGQETRGAEPHGASHALLRRQYLQTQEKE